jgi:hypothetical protein
VKKMKNILAKSLGFGVLLLAVGCKSSGDFDPPAATPGRVSAVMKQNFEPDSIAGKPLERGDGAKAWQDLAKGIPFSSRPDSFALQPYERAFNTQQTTERVFSEVGYQSPSFVPVDDTVPTPKTEPQPYRRLAGVIVSDSILALIDMGNGKLELIRPGQDIGGWHVDSIDGDKAVLTRGGNLLPKRIIVRLEEPSPFGRPDNAGGGGNPGGVGPGSPGGAPGGVPGGAPGAPGGRGGE